MNETYAAKQESAGCLGGGVRYSPPNTASEAQRATAQIVEALNAAHQRVTEIETSINIARQSLWGPRPEEQPGANIKQVSPDGFIPRLQASLAELNRRLDAVESDARGLRSL